MSNTHTTPRMRRLDDILVVESWLISVIEYIAIHTTARRSRKRGLELARPDQSAGNTVVYFNCVKRKHSLLLRRWLEQNQAIPCILPEYINHVFLCDFLRDFRSSMSPCLTRGEWGYG